MKIATLTDGWAITGTVIEICVGIIAFAFLVRWFYFVYCWMNDIADSQERIANAITRIADKNTGNKTPSENADRKEGGSKKPHRLQTKNKMKGKEADLSIIKPDFQEREMIGFSC